MSERRERVSAAFDRLLARPCSSSEGVRKREEEKRKGKKKREREGRIRED